MSPDLFDDEAANGPFAEINMIPLIDIMLVLLIIFMVTAPLFVHAVAVELPRAASTANSPRPDAVGLTIDATGTLHWNGERIDADGFTERLRAAGAQTTPPELRLHAERTTPYERIAQVISEAAKHGLTQIVFVTDPR